MVDINAGDHQGPEKITLAAFVHAEMRFEHFRRVDFFVAQFRFAQNFRLQFELHELFHAFALDEHLWSLLINGHAQFIFLSKEKRVLLRRKLESKLIEHLDEQVQRAGKMMESVQQIVDDPKMRKDLQDSIANMHTATETVNRIGNNMEKFTNDLQKLSNDTPGAIGDTRATIQKAQGHIDEISKQLADRLQQISVLLTQFQSIAGKVDKGEGTAGQLVNDPKLYQSLVDTSRELNATISDLKRLVEQWEQEGVSLKLK